MTFTGLQQSGYCCPTAPQILDQPHSERNTSPVHKKSKKERKKERNKQTNTQRDKV
jgi:hypothetical protein